MTFKTDDSSHKVNADITLKVWQDGNWFLHANVDNTAYSLRRVRIVCDLELDDATVRVDTDRVQVKRRTSRTLIEQAHSPFAANNFAEIIERGTADCDVVVGG